MLALLCSLALAAPLGEGAVAAPDQSLVFVASPSREVQAVELSKGTVRWSSAEAELPLAVHDDLLLAVEDRRSGQGMPLVLLSTSDGSRVGSCGELALPSWAAGLEDGLGTHTTLQGTWADGAFVVRWEASKRYTGGARPTPEAREAARRHRVGGLRCEPDPQGPILRRVEHLSAEALPELPAPAPVEAHDLRIRVYGHQLLAEEASTRSERWSLPLRTRFYVGPRPP